MKKLLTITAIVLFSFSMLQAQESMFKPGDKLISLGIGFGTSLYSGSYYSRGVPPVSLSFEMPIIEVFEGGVIGVGGWLGYTSYKYDYLGWGYKYSNIIIGAMGAFHYTPLDKLDTYAGFGLGYNIASSDEFGVNTGWDYSYSSGGVVYAFMVGARYYFVENFAVFLQAGYGVSYLTIGVSIKL